MLRAAAPLAMSLLLAACAAAELVDSDQIDKNAAYVALTPRITIGDKKPGYADLSLICVDTNKSSHTFYLPSTRNDQTVIVKTPPGACYLAGVKIPPSLSTSFKPVTTAFEARPDAINYAGDWQIEINPQVTVTIGAGYSDRSGIQGQVRQDQATIAEIQRTFPRLSSKLPVVYTGPKES